MVALLSLGGFASSANARGGDKAATEDRNQTQQVGETQRTGTDMTAGTFDQNTIRNVQQQLRDQGYDVQVDGIMGPGTQNALRRYQTDNDLQATGNLNQETIDALGVSVGERAPAAVKEGQRNQGTMQGDDLDSGWMNNNERQEETDTMDTTDDDTDATDY